MITSCLPPLPLINTLSLLLLPSLSLSQVTILRSIFFFPKALMETWENMPISSARHHHRNPSFSSSLLDQIYRSIDDSPPKNHRNPSLHEDREISPDHRLVFHRRSIAADFDRSTSTTVDSVFLRYSNSTYSDSSGFSSAESKSSASPPPHTRHHPKPIRTSVENSGVQKQDLGGFLRTKSKALKMYTDLKQPISPGGRLATFLNSLFTNNATTTNTKKPKKTESAVSSTTCSSASSFSRSCLSKTPSSSGKSKRSVRFCPVNVILDEEYSSSSSSGHGYSNENNNNHHHVMEEENRRVIEAAKDLLRTYQKNKAVTMTNVEEEEEEDDDAASCASSDLFELENLSAIGIGWYREELPVYETTRLDNTNRAIATSSIV